MSQPASGIPPSVLVIGDVCVDLLVEVPDKIADHRDHPEPELAGGGTGANVAVALTRLGMRAALMGTVGDDGYGRFALDGLRAEGVETTYLYSVRDAFTLVVLGLVHQDGEPLLFGWPARGSAQTWLHPSQVTRAIVAQFDWVHTTGLCLIEPPVADAVLMGMTLARELGIQVSCDLNLRLGFQGGRVAEGYLQRIREAMALSDYVFGSARDEFSLLTAGGPIDGLIDLLGTRNGALIVRMGADGAQAITQTATIDQPAFAVAVVDTVGAGDAFDAGFICARLEGHDLATALRWGNGVAALKIGRKGARGVPWRAEVDALLRQP